MRPQKLFVSVCSITIPIFAKKVLVVSAIHPLFTTDIKRSRNQDTNNAGYQGFVFVADSWLTNELLNLPEKWLTVYHPGEQNHTGAWA